MKGKTLHSPDKDPARAAARAQEAAGCESTPLQPPGPLAAVTLRDFIIQGAAELGACLGAQSFRAIRRCDDLPVLLHKFRPARSLVELEPHLVREEPPDFTKPFVTRFTHLFIVAGSAYLVEPLPPCFTLRDLWRHVVQNRPDRAFTVAAVMIHQLLPLVRRFVQHNCPHGALTLDNIVLASTATFGLLTAHLPCRDGRLWLRRDLDSPMPPDHFAFALVLGALLELEAETAALQNVPALLPAAVRHHLHVLLRSLEQAPAPADS